MKKIKKERREGEGGRSERKEEIKKGHLKKEHSPSLS